MGQMAHQLQAQKHDTDMLRQLIEEEQDAKQDLQKNLTRSNNEVGVWRNKYESDAVMRNQELEDEKKVLLGRLADSEEKVQAAVSRCESLGKAKDRLQNEVEDLTGELEKANAAGSGLEKKQRNFDKQLLEAKQKQGDLQVELDTALKDARNASNELFKYRTASYEIGDNLDNVLKKNKSFQEIIDLQALVQKGIKDGQDNEKSKREIDQERGDLQHQLQEAEAAIQAQESKFLKVQIELSQMQQTSERRLNEKEEDIDNARRIATKSIEQTQSNLDSEIRSKADVTRSSKKLEADLNDLDVALTTAKKQAGDAQKASKELSSQLKELNMKNDFVQRSTEEAREKSASAERRVIMMSTEIAELRNGLEQAERSRKQNENDLVDAQERAANLHTQNTSFMNQKKKIEAELLAVKCEVEEAISEARNGEDAANHAMTTAALLAENLKKEQDQAQYLERMKKMQEQAVKGLQNKLDEAEQIALKGSMKDQQKLETRCRELKAELQNENRKASENTKLSRKIDRKLKTTIYDNEEDKKTLERLNEQAEVLAGKMKVYKKANEAALEQANNAMGNYRKLITDLDEASERAEMAEDAVNRARNKQKLKEAQNS